LTDILPEGGEIVKKRGRVGEEGKGGAVNTSEGDPGRVKLIQGDDDGSDTSR